MGISVLYVRISSLDGKTDRQRVNEEDFDKVIEDKCSGSIPIFEREGGCRLKKLIDEGVISSISIWQIDRSRRDLRDILNFIHYTTQRKIPIHFIFRVLKPLMKWRGKPYLQNGHFNSWCCCGNGTEINPRKTTRGN